MLKYDKVSIFNKVTEVDDLETYPITTLLSYFKINLWLPITIIVLIIIALPLSTLMCCNCGYCFYVSVVNYYSFLCSLVSIIFIGFSTAASAVLVPCLFKLQNNGDLILDVGINIIE